MSNSTALNNELNWGGTDWNKEREEIKLLKTISVQDPQTQIFGRTELSKEKARADGP